MRKIEVAVLDSHNNPGGMMMFLAKLTQRGHNIHNMSDLKELFNNCMEPGGVKSSTIERVTALPHGTIKRFTPITVAIVGASRRFLAQARTHQVGVNYVSASLQYSDYTGAADFVVPYALIEADAEEATTYVQNTPFAHEAPDEIKHMHTSKYLNACNAAMETYKELAEATDNDTAGYAAPQGLRNILIMQANHEAWMHFIRVRGCNRNTVETQYVTMRIWEELLKTKDGEEMFAYAGPDCIFGKCREGKMCCGKPLNGVDAISDANKLSIPRNIIEMNWPLLKEV